MKYTVRNNAPNNTASPPHAVHRNTYFRSQQDLRSAETVHLNELSQVQNESDAKIINTLQLNIYQNI